MEFIKKVLREEEDEFNDVGEGSWIPGEPINKPPEIYSATNITNAKKSDMLKAIRTNKRFTIGDFVVIIDNSTHKENHVNMKIMQQVYKTATDKPCNMLVMLDITEDVRFSGCDWAKYFGKNLAQKSTFFGSTNPRAGTNIPEEKIIDILRYLQAANKLKAFL